MVPQGRQHSMQILWQRGRECDWLSTLWMLDG